MRYKVSFCKGLAVCAALFVLLFSSHLFSKTCLNFGLGTQLAPLLHTQQPVHTIINNGEDIIIEKPGSYQILENVTASIEVDSDDVIINLNGFTLTKSLNKSAAIRINQDKKNIVIKNGSIFGVNSGIGIQVSSGASFINLEDLEISTFNSGIFFSGIVSASVVNCVVTNCINYGIRLLNVSDSVFKNCQVCSCSSHGFFIFRCKYNKFIQCKVIDITDSFESGEAIGYFLVDGLDNLFYECMAEGVTLEDTRWGSRAAGFWLLNSSRIGETESKIIKCCVDSITGAGLGNGFGICLDFYPTSLLTVLTQKIFGTIFNEGQEEQVLPTVNDVDWSPQGEFVALALSDGTARVFTYDSVLNVMREVTSVTPNPVDLETDDPIEVTAVEWSPTGQYLAVGTGGRFVSETDTAWVGYYVDETSSYTTKIVEIEYAVGSNPELFVYMFDRFTLSQVTNKHLGIERFSIYDNNALLVTGGVNPADPAGTTTPAEEVLPGIQEPAGLSDLEEFSNHPTPIGNGYGADNTLRIVWSRDGRHLFVTTAGGSENTISGNPSESPSGPPLYEHYNYDYTYLNILVGEVVEQAKVVYFTFDGVDLNLIENKLLASSNNSKALAITPDDKFLAYGLNPDGIKGSINIDRFIPFYGLTRKISRQLSAAGEVNAVDWNPLACCGMYYLSVANFTESDECLQVFEFNADNNTLDAFNSLLTAHEQLAIAGANIFDVKWSPSGKDLVFTTSGTIDTNLFRFDPQAASVLTRVSAASTGLSSDLENFKYVDWSPCTQYLVVAGVSVFEEDPFNTVLLSTGGDCIKNCVVEQNKVANVAGGVCGIGIIGAGSANLIDKNLLSGSCVNASTGVFNTFYSMKQVNNFIKPLPLDNIAIVDICCP